MPAHPVELSFFCTELEDGHTELEDGHTELEDGPDLSEDPLCRLEVARDLSGHYVLSEKIVCFIGKKRIITWASCRFTNSVARKFLKSSFKQVLETISKKCPKSSKIAK